MSSCAILNSGGGSWAFEEHAARLSKALWITISSMPADHNYLLGWEERNPPAGSLFIPWEAIQVAADKRLQADRFEQARVPTPKTYLFERISDVSHLVSRESSKEWVLKFPISCGGSGHHLLEANSLVNEDWPRPYVVQEFIRMPHPEVYRLYCVAGSLLGWNSRRFPAGVKPSPWVAHARGARYVHHEEPPAEATDVALQALNAAGLLESFGAVDLVQGGGKWLALEVGTDGVFNHVDRDLDNPSLEEELNRKLAEAFWATFDFHPWGDYGWRSMPDEQALKVSVNC